MGETGTKLAQKVVVAMSGGVDSSVAAVLLKRAGFDVKGAFLKLFDSQRSDQGEMRVKKIARILKIPVQILDLRKEFKKVIIDYFLREYKVGRTPNPCVICNKEIKFKFLLDKARVLEADFIATGHYVRFRQGKLLKGRDKEKDQSYFLWMLNQRQLERCLFPVGGYTKKEVKLMAKKFKLPVFEVLESQEVCFVPTATNDFLARNIKQKPGRIIDVKGKTIGRHRGIYFYTIGQRKGIRLSGGPYWVSGKDIKRNLLIVTKNGKDLCKKELTCEKTNLLSSKLPQKIRAKIRYRQKDSLAIIRKMKNGKYKLVFSRPQKAITPGQSVVFYKGEELLGGGIIRE